jgi:hypothetical protein
VEPVGGLGIALLVLELLLSTTRFVLLFAVLFELALRTRELGKCRIGSWGLVVSQKIDALLQRCVHQS